MVFWGFPGFVKWSTPIWHPAHSFSSDDTAATLEYDFFDILHERFFNQCEIRHSQVFRPTSPKQMPIQSSIIERQRNQSFTTRNWGADHMNKSFSENDDCSKLPISNSHKCHLEKPGSRTRAPRNACRLPTALRNTFLDESSWNSLLVCCIFCFIASRNGCSMLFDNQSVRRNCMFGIDLPVRKPPTRLPQRAQNVSIRDLCCLWLYQCHS